MLSQLGILEERRKQLVAALEMAKKAQFEADGKMQSRYDTQKEDAAQEVAMYQSLIADIDVLIEKLRTLEPRASNGVVEVGCRVTLEFDDGEKQDFLILDNLGGVDLKEFQTLSTASPVGKAVLGARVGDTVSVELPGGTMEVRIRRIY